MSFKIVIETFQGYIIKGNNINGYKVIGLHDLEGKIFKDITILKKQIIDFTKSYSEF